MAKSRSIPYTPITPRTYNPYHTAETSPGVRPPTKAYDCETCADDPNRCRCVDDRDGARIDTSQFVHIIRPAGLKCETPDCPYNDNAYYKSGGKCLNCLDDQRRGLEEMQLIYNDRY